MKTTTTTTAAAGTIASHAQTVEAPGRTGPRVSTKHTPTTTAESLAMVAAALETADRLLQYAPWTAAECDNQQLGVDVDALRAHIDNARGRNNMIRRSLSAIAAAR
jgi:hypothetical protein